GHLGEALRPLEQSMEWTASSLLFIHPLAVTRLSEAYLLAGRTRDARALAERALTLAREQKQRGIEAWALRLLGEIVAQVDSPDTDQAGSYYRQALAIAQELGMRPLAAHCHLGLGTLYQKIDRDDEAHTELATAAAMYRAMEMSFWLEKAEAALPQAA